LQNDPNLTSSKINTAARKAMMCLRQPARHMFNDFKVRTSSG
jgi:hypothetical protein